MSLKVCPKMSSIKGKIAKITRSKLYHPCIRITTKESEVERRVFKSNDENVKWICKATWNERFVLGSMTVKIGYEPRHSACMSPLSRTEKQLRKPQTSVRLGLDVGIAEDST